MDELSYLMNFNQSISFAMARAMQDVSDFVFISMANLKLERRDSYLDHVKPGINLDTLADLRKAPYTCLYFWTQYCIKHRKRSLNIRQVSLLRWVLKKQGHYNPYFQQTKPTQDTGEKSGPPTRKLLSSSGQNKSGLGKVSNYSQ